MMGTEQTVLELEVARQRVVDAASGATDSGAWRAGLEELRQLAPSFASDRKGYQKLFRLLTDGLRQARSDEAELVRKRAEQILARIFEVAAAATGSEADALCRQYLDELRSLPGLETERQSLLKKARTALEEMRKRASLQRAELVEEARQIREYEAREAAAFENTRQTILRAETSFDSKLARKENLLNDLQQVFADNLIAQNPSLLQLARLRWRSIGHVGPHDAALNSRFLELEVRIRRQLVDRLR